MIACLGIALALKGANRTFKQTGAAIALGAGSAVAAVLVQDERTQETEHLQQESHLAAIDRLQHEHEQRESALKTFLDRVMAESERLKSQIVQMHEVLAEDQNEKVLIFSELERLEREHQHVLYELWEMAIAQPNSQQQIGRSAHSGSDSETNPVRSEAAARIAELEATLADKTNMAAQMLTELEAEATSTFNQFTAKIASQSKVIDNLYQQVETLKQENASLFREQLGKQIERARADSLTGAPAFGQHSVSR